MFLHARFGSNAQRLQGKPGFQVDLCTLRPLKSSHCTHLGTEPSKHSSIPQRTDNSLAAIVVVARTAIHTSLGARHQIPQAIVYTVFLALEQQLVIMVVPSRSDIGAFEPGPNVVGSPAWEKILVKT